MGLVLTCNPTIMYASNRIAQTQWLKITPFPSTSCFYYCLQSMCKKPRQFASWNCSDSFLSLWKKTAEAQCNCFKLRIKCGVTQVLKNFSWDRGHQGVFQLYYEINSSKRVYTGSFLWQICKIRVPPRGYWLTWGWAKLGRKKNCALMLSHLVKTDWFVTSSS